jgi:hypothetical protein
MIGSFFTKAKNKHEKTFAAAGKAINEKLRLYAKVGSALIDAREKGAILSQQSKPIPIFRFGLTSGIRAFLIIYNRQRKSMDPICFLSGFEGMDQVRTRARQVRPPAPA